MSLLARQRAFMAAIVGEAPVDPPGWDARARAGLAIYRNAYRARLMACMQESYALVRAWVGAEGFDAAAAHHLIRNPPASWTLDDAGAGFDETLASLFPADPEVAELAWLEWQTMQAFVAPDEIPLDAASFAAATAELDEAGWAALRLRLVGSLSARRSVTRAADLWHALKADATPPEAILRADEAGLLVWRDGFAARVRALPVDEAHGLAMMGDGAGFGALCAWLARSYSDADAVTRAGALLGQWITDGLVAHVDGRSSAAGADA